MCFDPWVFIARKQDTEVLFPDIREVMFLVICTRDLNLVRLRKHWRFKGKLAAHVGKNTAKQFTLSVKQCVLLLFGLENRFL